VRVRPAATDRPGGAARKIFVWRPLAGFRFVIRSETRDEIPRVGDLALAARFGRALVRAHARYVLAALRREKVSRTGPADRSLRLPAYL